MVAAEVVHGTGRFIADDVSRAASMAPAPVVVGDPVSLDFLNADARDVVRSVLGDVLKLPYAVDPAVQGTITLQTGEPVPRSAVIPALENALRLGGIALVAADGLYKVMPVASAGREARIGASTAVGIVARMITLHYVTAADLQRVLEPLLPSGTSLRAEPTRNVLIVSGPAQDVLGILDNVAVFDVDYLKGMSFALLPLHAAPASAIAKEVTTLLSATGSVPAGMAKILPIERLNAVLVTALQPGYLDRVRDWVERLDKGASGIEQQLFVYRVQNGRATDLASVLRKALGIDATAANGGQSGPASGSSQTPVAEDAAPVPVASPLSASAPANAGTPVPNILLGNLPGAPPTASSAPSPLQSSSPSPTGSDSSGSDIKITADETNNALLILASPQHYALIESALQQLDIAPLQVLVEAVVAEVTLTNQLSFGLQYYLKAGNFQGLFSQTSANTSTATPTSFNFAQGLNFAYTSPAGSGAILQLLQQLTEVRVLSSPDLLVINNHTARIQVGDQVPIATQSAVSLVSTGAPLVNSIEYRDTGVILTITPRVNASGLVMLDISQEVSEVSNTTTSTLDSPTISQRRINSTVAVADGQAIALGGLITDNSTRSKNGIPVLQDIPLLGSLFGTRSNTATRSELVVLITPHVIRDRAAGRAVTDELQRKLPLTIPLLRPKPQ
jgi:general secretion pathway protein D